MICYGLIYFTSVLARQRVGLMNFVILCSRSMQLKYS